MAGCEREATSGQVCMRHGQDGRGRRNEVGVLYAKMGMRVSEDLRPELRVEGEAESKFAIGKPLGHRRDSRITHKLNLDTQAPGQNAAQIDGRSVQLADSIKLRVVWIPLVDPDYQPLRRRQLVEDPLINPASWEEALERALRIVLHARIHVIVLLQCSD